MNEAFLSHVQEEHPRDLELKQQEDYFDEQLKKLRQQGRGVEKLADEWEGKYDRVEDEEKRAIFFNDFKTFLKRREEALSAIDIGDPLSDDARERIRQLEGAVTTSFGKPDLLLGNGATAEVYALHGFEGVCVKYIVNQGKYDEGNHMRKEYNFLKRLREVKYGIVCAPETIFLRIHPRDGHSYAMEKVEGKSLSRILERPHEAIDLIQVVRGLDKGVVLRDVLGYLEHMHAQGITHNDLYARNIMLSRDGRFFLIDFGKALHQEDEEKHAMRAERDRVLATSELRRFFRDIDNLNI